MRLSNQSDGVRPYPELWDTLERLRAALDFPVSNFADRLGITEKQYLRYRSTRKPLSVLAVTALCEFLDVSLEGLVSGKLDFRTVAFHFSGERDFVPERYSGSAFSKKRTSVHLLDYIEQYYGWHYKNMIMRQLQVKEPALSNPDGEISLNFLTDLCDVLEKRGFTPEMIYAMGGYSLVANQNADLGKICRQAADPAALYERMVTELANTYFDKNYQYRLLSLSPHRCVIEAEPNAEAADAMRTDRFGSTLVCSAKAGCFAIFPGYMDLPFSEVKELSCVHWGDATCRFSVDYSAAFLMSESNKHERNSLGKVVPLF